MSAESYAMFRILIKDFKDGDLSYDRFCEIADEMAADEWEQASIVKGIYKYLEALPSNNNADVKNLDFDEKSELAEVIAEYVERFLPVD